MRSKSLPQNLRVIDTVDGCIVRAPPCCRYLALSYVWGNVEQPMLTQATSERLSTPRALLGEFWTKLPKTIQDTITLSGLIGERYLWVDSLCIVRDSDDDKNIQIAQMNFVYQHAIVTIVSASGLDCNAGLPGLHRLPKADYESSKFSQEMLESVWMTRAWTLQESVLSRRRLIFTRNDIFFHCSSAVWKTVDNPQPSNSPTDPEVDLGHASELSIGYLGIQGSPEQIFHLTYKVLVKAFVGRNLTKDSDSLMAFSGIMAVLEPNIGKFLYGLPIHYFLAALCWHNDGSHTRRNDFPSWSWAGWRHSREGDFGFEASDRLGAVIKFHYINTSGHLECLPDGVSLAPTYLRHRLAIPNIRLDEAPFVIRRRRQDVSTFHFFNSSYCQLLLKGSENKMWYQVCNGYGKITTIFLPWDSEWENMEHSFIIYSYLGNDFLRAMLIQWDSSVDQELPIAYRVQVTKDIHINDWMKAGPEPRLIILG